MGLIDVDTMNKAREELDAMNRGKRDDDSVRSLSQVLSRHKSGMGSDVDSKIFDDIIARRK